MMAARQALGELQLRPDVCPGISAIEQGCVTNWVPVLEPSKPSTGRAGVADRKAGYVIDDFTHTRARTHAHTRTPG